MKRLLYISLFLTCFVNTNAQNLDIKRTYNWYFGLNAGLNFNNGSAVAITNGQLISDASCASISDTAGHLLFYTDGRNVWNKNHQLMPNGNGTLRGNNNSRVTIVPKPLNDSLYYIFDVQTYSASSPDTIIGLQYSIVNMKLQGSLGDIMVKNYHVIDSTWERLAAVKHTNGKDIWIVAMKALTNNIYCYLLTTSGLQPPVINSIGHPDNYGGQDFKFSASGRKLALAATLDGSEIFDFDAATGILSNPVLFPACFNCGDADVEFSPDETKLYFTRFFGTNTTQLYQVDLAAGTPTAMVNSITLIDSAYFLVEIQRGKDGRIYVANNTRPALGVINNPNALGTACQFDTNGVFLNGKQSTEGLPNFVSSYFYDSTLLAGIKQVSGINNQLTVYPNPSAGIIHIACADAKCTSTNEAAKITISNMLGQAIKQFKIEDLGVPSGSLAIDASDLPNGMYIIEINTTQYQTKQKLIINK